MKLAVLITFLTSSQAVAINTFSQEKINLRQSNISIMAILRGIEARYDYRFVYSDSVALSRQKIDVLAKDASIDEVMQKVLRTTGFSYKKMNKGLIVITGNEDGIVAELPVKGTVTDENGLPVSGANVVEKGTSNGTVTNDDGSFLIEVKDQQSVLVISVVGFKTKEVAVAAVSSGIILEKSDGKLDEVIVVGYGTQKKSDITGSITSVNEKALREVPAANLSQALQGRGAGIDIQKGGGNSKPGASPVIRIRGVRSISADNGPLFVVDGIPYNGNINDLNPDDIVSVEILKDASATAIYGSRGANGVILVTSKRGRNGKAVISYSGYAGYVKNLGKIEVMNGEEFALLKKWAAYNGNFLSNGNRKYTGIDDPKIIEDGVFATQEIESMNMGRSTDWQDLIYKKGLNTDHQVSVSGGSEKTQYAMSAGYHNETGIYPGQSFERYSVRINVDQQLGKAFKIGLSSLNNYSITKGENANPMGQVLRASPLATPYDENGNLWGFVPGSANQVWNPLGDFVEGAKVENRKRTGTFTTLYLDVNLAKGLKYKFNAGAEIRSDIYGNFYASATSNNLGGLSTSRNRTEFSTNYTLENILTYNRVFAEKHKLDFTGLFSLQESQGQTSQFDNNDIVADQLWYYNPTFGSNLKGVGSYAKWDIVSLMGRLNYGFKNKYLATVTVRSDGSSRLAPGNQFKAFPSGVLAWNMGEEDFIKNALFITNLKLRVGYGKVGNTAIDPYQTLGALSAAVYNYGDQTTTGVYLSDVPNPDLTWEYTATTNIGLDFGFFNGRISGAIDLYKQATSSLLLPQSLPPTSGISNPIVTNVGKTENKGIEIQLNTVNIAGDGRSKLSWTSDINFFLNRGKITQLQEGVLMDITNSRFVGYPIGTIYDYRKIGIWQNTAADSALAKSLGLSLAGTGSVIGNIRVEDVNGDSKINASDRVILGSSQPKWSAGFTNRLAYKNFDFTVVAFGRFGSTITSRMHNSGFANTFQGNYNNLRVHYWTPENNENFWPKANAASTNTPNNSTLGYFDGTFVKIRSLTLGYNLPASFLKANLRSARVYVTANDAFILFSKYRSVYKGIDPEAINGGNNRGEINVDTPATYSILFGLNITF
ncbi:SusC/RagA family TonB-linked outer membrane protein [Niabella pedocola]|uniref:SusC/RagA family TonB-linked outer membrane protein n=1 Tax=Niabella pedocola TaxID=1752077 RepID=A0ABS8PNE0_9BACT|nr:SusC/RagA family TonB-linked outer membrane protein [Niabella pedocola]MCD2422600.1 SusC/RagA family TonB-linked outer membrane protein [Niabella pedocola]